MSSSGSLIGGFREYLSVSITMTLVIYRRELKSLFSSWVAYVVLIAFILISGVVFYLAVELFEQMTRYAATIEEGAARQGWNLLERLIHPLYNVIFLLLFVMVPAITMRLFAEEKKQRTYELLLTSPVTEFSIVLGKYLAAVTLITLMLLPVVIFPMITMSYGRPDPDWGPMFTGYLGLFMLGYSLAAIGVFASTLTENQIVAFVFALGLEMLFFFIAQASISIDVVSLGGVAVNMGAILREMSISNHFQPMLMGLLRLSDFIYFACLISFWLWATSKSVESARWG